MHQSFDKYIIQFHKDTKAGDSINSAPELVTNMILHIFTFEPANNIPTGLIRAPFCHGTMLAQGRHMFPRIGVPDLFWFGVGIIDALNITAALFTLNYTANGTMHK